MENDERARVARGMTDDDERRMREHLQSLTVRELKDVARAEGICLGYAGATKAGTIDEIIANRRYRDFYE